MNGKLRLGIIGLGHLGKIHLKCAIETGVWDVVGCYDVDIEVGQKAIEAYPQVRLYEDIKKLIVACDALVVVTPTSSHFTIAKQAIEAGKHVFIEKPITHTVSEARRLVALKQKHGVLVQIGHVERFNPAFLALKDVALRPAFIEIHRLAMYQPRGTDVSVVLDLMIHDLDLVLHLLGDEVRFIHASGVKLLSSTPDIANVRLEMKHGAVVNLTASRISLKQMRKVRIFQEDAYVSMDFLEKKAQIIRMFATEADATAAGMLAVPMETVGQTRYIGLVEPEVLPVNAIVEEIKSFETSIRLGTEPLVSAEDGLAALSLAHRIMRTIERHQKTI